MKLTVKNRSQQIRSKQMVDQLSSGMIGGDCHIYPTEDYAAISRDAHIALEIQQLEEDEVHNMENKEHMIMRDGKLSTMMQHQEEDKAQKLTDKEQQAMASTTTGKALIIVQRLLYLNHFLQYYIPQNLGVTPKVRTLAMESMFFFADRLLHLQAVFRVAVTIPLWT